MIGLLLSQYVGFTGVVYIKKKIEFLELLVKGALFRKTATG